MGSLQAEAEMESDLNDSGLGQEESLPMKKHHQYMETENRAQLLDLSDDVLLMILNHCTPRDLKALGFTCSRFGALILDRTLWERVDARNEPVGADRIRWLLKYGITGNTTEILLSGYAKQIDRCLGLINHRPFNNKIEALAILPSDVQYLEAVPRHLEAEDADGPVCEDFLRRGLVRGGPVVEIYESMPHRDMRQYGFPDWRHDDAPSASPLPGASQDNDKRTVEEVEKNACPGPHFSFTSAVLMQMEKQCPKLTSLALEYVNIDCINTSICHFPRNLKVLSLRGSKCFSQTSGQSFVFKIQDHLTLLEDLNVSECEWVEPSALLPLSKLPSLRRLYMRNCCKLSECVAYSSLATRYGFKTLQVIDLRESPVGDSEVSSLGWLATLEELYVSPAKYEEQSAKHGHHIGNELKKHKELDPWEEKEPEYMRKLIKPNRFSGGEKSANKLKRKRTKNPNESRDDINDSAECCQKLEAQSPTKNKNSMSSKRPRQEVNEGASTSQSTKNIQEPSTSKQKSAPKTTKKRSSTNHKAETEPAQPSNENSSMSEYCSCPPQNRAPSGDGADPQGPVQKVLYVNVCRRVHAMFRLSMPVYTVEEPANALGDNPSRWLNVSTGPFTTNRLDYTSLVSDTSVHRFGRADTDNVNYINIGPNGIQRDVRDTRPDRSNLRILHMRGFRNITNRSLVHLATAAPNLTLIDFTGTRVNELGVENFKSLRPNCEVLFTKREDRKGP